MRSVSVVVVLILWVCCFTDAAFTAEVASDIDRERQCSIYMAPSSVKGLRGYGVFTTRDIEAGSAILSAPDSPSIPVLDVHDYENEALEQFIAIFSEYWWSRGCPDHVAHEAVEAVDFQTTFGSLPNHHCILDSLDMRYPEIPYDDSLVQRNEPGAGGFSYNMGREFTVSKDLTAGDEIFLNYGYCERNQDAKDWTASFPMPEDYEKAADIVWEWLKSTGDEDANIAIPKGTDRLVAALLPNSLSHLHEIMGSNKVESREHIIPLLAKHTASTPRTPDWIKANGMCLEHLVPRKSHIVQAGQGGFAQHHIGKGEIVVPAPMLQITDRDALIMYDEDDNPKGWQLLINYCFSHHESSMLLCPATNAGLINHCSNRTKECGADGPNAMVRWSSGWDPTSDEWRQMTVDEITEEQGRGLSMEIVALRDIESGEEVYIDYGEEWEEAWAKHVATWKPPMHLGDSHEEFVSAKDANEQEELNLLVTGDLRNVTNHPYLFTGCRYWPTKQDKDRVWNQPDLPWEEWEDEEILSDFSDDGSPYQGDYSHHKDKSHWPCSVLYKEEDGAYTVRIHQADWSPPKKWHRNNLPRILTNYPRESIHYFVKPYSSDQHLPGAFRQPIGIPEEIFPEQWKNLEEEND